MVKEFRFSNNELTDNLHQMFRFRFASEILSNTCHPYVYSVYSDNKEDIELFIKQHSFNTSNVFIDNIDISNKDTYQKTLEPFLFKSNNDNRTYTIMSSIFIINSLIEDVYMNLSASMMFGEIISSKHHIQLFDTIKKLIDGIPYAYLFTQDDIDADPVNIDNVNDEMIGEKLMCASAHNKLQPVTLEAYVEYFTHLIIR